MNIEIEQAKSHFEAAVRLVSRGAGARERNVQLFFAAFQDASKILKTNTIPEDVFGVAQDGSAGRYLQELADRGCFGEDTVYRGGGSRLKFSRIQWGAKETLPFPRKNGTRVAVAKQKEDFAEDPKKNGTPHIAFPASSVEELATALAAKLQSTESARTESARAEPKGRIPVFAFIDVPNLRKFDNTQEKFIDLNFLALKGLLFNMGEYLHTAKVFLTAPRGYNVMTIRSWGFDSMLRAVGFEPEYDFHGKDIDPLMREEIASAAFFNGLSPGNKCIVISGSGDHGYIEALKKMKATAARRDIHCRIRAIVRKGSSSLHLGELIRPEDLIVIDQFPVYMY